MSTGASNDFEKATNIARDMVIKYGFSAKLGAASFGNGGEVFIGRDMAQAREYSEATAQQIDAEVRLILDAAHDEAYKALMTNRKVLDELAKQLMERETLQQEDIARIFKNVKKLPKRKVWLSSKSRPVSTKPPIAIPARIEKDAAKPKAAPKAAAKPKTPAKPKATPKPKA